MGHALTIDIPDETFETLQHLAKFANYTPEEWVAQWLASMVLRVNRDPLLKLAGMIESGVTDVAERHDDYLGEAALNPARVAGE